MTTSAPGCAPNRLAASMASSVCTASGSRSYSASSRMRARISATSSRVARRRVTPGRFVAIVGIVIASGALGAFDRAREERPGDGLVGPQAELVQQRLQLADMGAQQGVVERVMEHDHAGGPAIEEVSQAAVVAAPRAATEHVHLQRRRIPAGGGGAGVAQVIDAGDAEGGRRAQVASQIVRGEAVAADQRCVGGELVGEVLAVGPRAYQL